MFVLIASQSSNDKKGTNLYYLVLYFKDTSLVTTPTESTIAVRAETTTFTDTTTSDFAVAEEEALSSTYATTTTTNNNNKTYFLKLRGRSQGDPMEGFPQYCRGNGRN